MRRMKGVAGQGVGDIVLVEITIRVREGDMGGEEGGNGDRRPTHGAGEGRWRDVARPESGKEESLPTVQAKLVVTRGGDGGGRGQVAVADRTRIRASRMKRGSVAIHIMVHDRSVICSSRLELAESGLCRGRSNNAKRELRGRERRRKEEGEGEGGGTEMGGGG